MSTFNVYNILLSKLLFFCSFGATFSLRAQPHVGFRAGIHFAHLVTTEDGTITKAGVPGLNAVLFFDFGLGKRLALQSELGFIQKGFKTKIAVLGVKNYTTTFNYLDLNALLKYRFNGKKLQGYGLFGPYLGGALSGKQKDASDGETTPVKFDAPGGFKRADWGLIAGGGFGLPAGRGTLLADLRYHVGLLAINEHYLANGDMRHRGFSISIGYALPL